MKTFFQSLEMRVLRVSVKTVFFGLVLGLALTALSFTVYKPVMHPHLASKKFAKQVWLQYYDPNLGLATVKGAQLGSSGRINGTDCGINGDVSGSFSIDPSGNVDINVVVTIGGVAYPYSGIATLYDSSPCVIIPTLSK